MPAPKCEGGNVMRCIRCGGNLEKNSNGKYACIYCGWEYSGEEERPVRSVGGMTSSSASEGADIFEVNKCGTLDISCRGRTAAWSGSGYIISLDGYAVTNAHVAAEKDGSACKDIRVRVNGQTVPATVIALADNLAGSGKGPDLALIKLASVPIGARKLEFADFNTVKTGQRVYVIGNSLGDGMCMTGGIVSDRRRMINGKPLLMTDCAINGGNSGGPIFNDRGKVIGTICSSRVHNDGSATEGMNYAVPADVVLSFISSVSPRLARQLGV